MTEEPGDFSLAGGGLLNGLVRRRGRWMLYLLPAVAWLPLLVLSAIDGYALGNRVAIPFLKDYGAYGRLLIAIPVLLFAEIPIGKRTRQVVQGFSAPGFIADQDISAFRAAVENAGRRKDAVQPDLVILGIIYITSALRAHPAMIDHLTTWYSTNSALTSAGWYYLLVSLPLFQFLLIRWLWRIGIWTRLLWRISRLNLHLLPIHPDRFGGLGFLALAEIPLGLIGFAGGCVISSYVADGMMYYGSSLTASTGILLAYIILAALVILAPVVAFTGKLIELRARGILTYGGIGEEYASAFDDKWARGINPEKEPILGTSDIQSLADLRNSFDIVQNLSIVAIDRKSVTIVLALAAIPMIPLFLLGLPFHKIVAKLIGL